MIKVQKQTNDPITLIRTATGAELSEYEKQKLASISANAQPNKLELIYVNGVRVPIDSTTKAAQIDLGGLAFKDTISPEDLHDEKPFFIKCELDESVLTNK